MACLEALGEGCADNGLLFALNAHMWACETPILKFGTDEQKRKWVPGLASGALIGGFASAEPSAGSDAFSMRLRATPKGDGFILNGQKTFITNAPMADVLVVIARLDGTEGSEGLTAFLVEKGTPGLSVLEMEKLGIRTSPMGEVSFADCEVPATSVLGKVGVGTAVFNEAMAWERAFILATAVGAMQRQLDGCVGFSKRHKEDGRPIGKTQSVAHRLAEMRLRVEAARMLLYRVAWLKGQGRHIMLEAAIAKLFISEAWVASSLDALHVHGEEGRLTQNGVERDLRDAMGSRIYSGTSEIQRMIIAQHMGL